jgi:methyl-accepting chemotaxis protein
MNQMTASQIGTPAQASASRPDETAGSALATRGDRLAFMNINEADRAALRNARPFVQAVLPEILDSFYEQVTHWPELQSLFKNPEHLRAARSLQLKHWDMIVTGAFDDAYFASAHRIGLAHNKIGLEPRWYIAGYSFIVRNLLSRLATRHFGSAIKLTRADGAYNDMAGALIKAAMLDMDLAISAYFDAGRTEYRQKLVRMTDTFDETVARFIENLSSATDKLIHTSTEMDNVAGAGTTGAQSLGASSAAAMENVNSVASASEEMLASIKEINTQVNRASEVSQAAVTQMRDAAATIAALKEQSEKIGEIVRLINAVASQTNLLALNATIEAARAGDAGKGFAVVANEVKILASQTGKATDEISRQVSAIQESTDRAVQAINATSGTVDQVNAVAAAIASAMEEQSATMAEIVRNTHSAAARAGEVGDAAKEVASGATHAKGAASSIAVASQDLAQRTTDLRGSVEVFLSHLKHSQ